MCGSEFLKKTRCPQPCVFFQRKGGKAAKPLRANSERLLHAIGLALGDPGTHNVYAYGMKGLGFLRRPLESRLESVRLYCLGPMWPPCGTIPMVPMEGQPHP
jgi:hypothetical protein